MESLLVEEANRGGLKVREGMAKFSQFIKTGEGELIIHGPVGPELLSSLKIDSGLKSFRPPHKQHAALIEISRLEFGRVIIAQFDQTLVGYVTFHPPDDFEHWVKGPKELLELGAIEVSPRFRRHGTGRRLLEVAFSDPVMERLIIFATEYYWHWDLEGTSLNIWEYREMMRNLMEHVGMTIKDTDEVEISSHPANMLMVRYGNNVPKTLMLEFEKLLIEKPDSNRR